MTEQELEDCREQFRAHLTALKDSFVETLSYAKGTKNKYNLTLGWLIEYLYGYTNNIEIKTIKKGDVFSRFYSYTKYDYDFPDNYKKHILLFFEYLKEQGYENSNVLKASKK
jgi:hypothetical protein